MSNGFGPLKPVEQVAREYEAKQRGGKARGPHESVTVHVERTVKDPRQEHSNAKPTQEKSVQAKVAEIRAKFEAQRAQEKQRGR